MTETALVNEVPFFAPSNSDAVDFLFSQYRAERANIEAVNDFLTGPEMLGAIDYFLRGNRQQHDRYVPDAKAVFNIAMARKALDASYWNRALRLTDVRDYMPDARRREFDRQIEKMETPEFTEETVRATLQTLLAQRLDFLSEMVDGIFRGLSGEHVTNRPEGFSKRMIIDWVFGAYGTCDRKSGLIHDLRCVVAKFMGRDTPYYSATRQALEHFRNGEQTGRWHWMDGCAFRIRVYKKGTAHMEIHPHIAYRLNQILAHRYPHAIPAQHQTKPKTVRLKEFDLLQQPLPFAVLKEIAAGRYSGKCWTASYDWRDGVDKHTRRRVLDVLSAIGGAVEGDVVRFDYDAREVIGDVLASGIIPDAQSHQFYPTPDHLAQQAVAWAEVGPDDICLEPSAGQGAIATHLPAERTLCVEVSALNAKVLEAKKLSVQQADFLEIAPTLSADVVVCNPPFSQGRAKAHVLAAAKCLRPGGRLVAIVPASMSGKIVIPGMRCEWSQVYDNEFAGTSISVVMLKAIREKTQAAAA